MIQTNIQQIIVESNKFSLNPSPPGYSSLINYRMTQNNFAEVVDSKNLFKKFLFCLKKIFKLIFNPRYQPHIISILFKLKKIITRRRRKKKQPGN